MSRPPTFYLSDIQGLFGGQSVFVHQDGTCIVRRVTVSGWLHGHELREHRYLAELPPNSVEKLVQIAEKTGFEHYREKRSAGIPDEGHPIIGWQKTSDTHIEASKWAGEKAPKFDPLYSALLRCIEDATHVKTLYRGSFDYRWGQRVSHERSER